MRIWSISRLNQLNIHLPLLCQFRGIQQLTRHFNHQLWQLLELCIQYTCEANIFPKTPNKSSIFLLISCLTVQNHFKWKHKILNLPQIKFGLFDPKFSTFKVFTITLFFQFKSKKKENINYRLGQTSRHLKSYFKY